MVGGILGLPQVFLKIVCHKSKLHVVNFHMISQSDLIILGKCLTKLIVEEMDVLKINFD